MTDIENSLVKNLENENIEKFKIINNDVVIWIKREPEELSEKITKSFPSKDFIHWLANHKTDQEVKNCRESYSDDEKEDVYIIVSVKHTDMNKHPLIFTLWASDFCGYTINFEKAGKYTRAEIEQHEKIPIIDKPIKSLDNTVDSFAIAIDKIEEFGLTKNFTIGF